MANCKKCGVFLPKVHPISQLPLNNILKSGDKTFKTNRMMYKAFFNVQEVKDNLHKRQIYRGDFQNFDYIIHRKRLIIEMFELAKKLKLSQNTA